MRNAHGDGQPTVPTLGPIVRILFDRPHQRLQVINGESAVWHWDGDGWYFVPFLRSDEDFLHMARLLAMMVGAGIELETGISLGPAVRYRNWPTSMLVPTTAIAYHRECGQIEIHHPDPTLGVPPIKLEAHFLRRLDDFQLWAIMIGKLARLSPRPIPEFGAGKVDQRVSMFCFC